MDALSLLKEDHQKVKKMLAELDSTTERGVKTRDELFTKLKGELQVHESIEEEIFYPALKEHPKAKELVLEAYEEHNVVDTVMSEIEGVAYDDERWGRQDDRAEGEPRAPHRGGRDGDVQASSAGLRTRGAGRARIPYGEPEARADGGGEELADRASVVRLLEVSRPVGRIHPRVAAVARIRDHVTPFAGTSCWPRRRPRAHDRSPR